MTVFERRAEPGGALRHALSPIRISHDMVDAEVNRIKSMGVNFVCNADINDITSLAEGFDGVFVSPGLQKSRKVDIQNKDNSSHWATDGIVGALKFLDSANSFSPEAAKKAVAGKRIVVVGGGSVAMDCAITAKSFGATAVHVVAVESLLKWPADVDEIKLARSAGAIFHPEMRVTSVGCDNTVFMSHLSEDGKMRPNLQCTTLEASTIIVAAGQMLDETGKKLVEGNPSQGIIVKRLDELGLTIGNHRPLVVSGGDAARGGGDTVVRAIADGKLAAEAMTPLHAAPERIRASLQTEFVGISFMNPFTLSSSPVTNSAEMIARAYDAGFAGAYYKTLNREDKFLISHPSPRLNVVHARNSTGMDIGIQNVEQISDRPLADNLADIAWLRKNYPKHITAVSIMGFSDEDWAYLAAAAEVCDCDSKTVNITCCHCYNCTFPGGWSTFIGVELFLSPNGSLGCRASCWSADFFNRAIYGRSEARCENPSGCKTNSKHNRYGTFCSGCAAGRGRWRQYYKYIEVHFAH